MTTASALQHSAAGDDVGAPSRHAQVLSVGCATPALKLTQHDIAELMARTWDLDGADLDRWERIVAGSAIETRHGVLPPDIVAPMTTAQRMQAFEEFAPEIASQAAREAMIRAGIDSHEVSDVVVVSCTGFAAPGVDVALVERLGLPRTTRRTMIGFMGCFGAINGLRVASGLCAADPNAVVLLVCVELCSLHMRTDPSAANLVASALFADGAAAVVLAGSHVPCAQTEKTIETSRDRANRPIGVVGCGASLLLPEGRDWMSWRVTDHGFAMTLTREVPVALRREIRSFSDRLGDAADGTYIVHPGGPGVIDAVDDGLELEGARGIEVSRSILRSFGNMSSATSLFVLEEAIRTGRGAPFSMLAFGPGLTIEGLRIEPASSSAC